MVRCIPIIVLVGCFSPSPQAGVPCAVSGECPTGLVCAPATNTCERFPTTTDAALGGAIDSATDASIDASPDGSMDPMIVARYLFDDDVEDEGGVHDGVLVGSGHTYPNGRNGATDHALALPVTLTAHVSIPDAPAFDIASGTIDLWFRYDGTAPAGDLGLGGGG
ncbi:MAG: hypothetical protein ACKV2T_20980, partial [Kofleriaceae bacterium]